MQIPKQRWEYQFHVSVRDCEWKIVTYGLKGGANVGETCTTRAIDQGRVSYVRKRENVSRDFAMVEATEYPNFWRERMAACLWLGFASACQPLGEGSNAVPSFFQQFAPPTPPSPPMRPGRWVRHAQPQGFPEQIEFYNAKGQTGAYLTTIGWTNVGRLDYPKGFEFAFSEVVDAYKQPVILAGATVTNVRVAVIATNFQPDLTRETKVIDARFENGPNPIPIFGYTVKDNRWRTEAEARQIYEEQKRRREAARTPP